LFSSLGMKTPRRRRFQSGISRRRQLSTQVCNPRRRTRMALTSGSSCRFPARISCSRTRWMG
jgi:hypothetical protein